MTKPDFIIIGAMKSATSTLHEQLALQQGIFMSTPKEPNFFSDDDIYKKGLGWYSSLFEQAKTDELCGESSTHYTKLPDYPKTLQRMKAYLPNLKLVYVVRHPIERLVSHYIHQWSQNVIRTDINNAIDSFPELVNYSCYSMQLAPYIELYGAENILIVFSEALRQNPERELKAVAEFIGYQEQVKWYDELEEQNVSNQRVRKFSGYSFIVDNSVMSFLRKTFIPQNVRDYIKKCLTMKKRPEINSEQYRKLEAVFEKDLAKLAELTDANISLGSYNEIATEVGYLQLISGKAI